MASIRSMKSIQWNPHITDSFSFILNVSWVIDSSLILLDTSWGKYSIPRESIYVVTFLSIYNEAQCVSLLF